MCDFAPRDSIDVLACAREHARASVQAEVSSALVPSIGIEDGRHLRRGAAETSLVCVDGFPGNLGEGH